MKTSHYFSLLISLLFSINCTIFSQQAPSGSGKDKLKLFIGEWKLKGDIWRSSFDGKYSEDLNPNAVFIAKPVTPENTILWNGDFGGGNWFMLLWTYHQQTGRLNHISNTLENNIGIGVGEFNGNNDLKIKIHYPNGCTTCHRIYSYRWNNPNELEFQATIYNNDTLTRDFYGGTLIRKVK